MQKIKVKLTNCYGIRELEKEFDFSETNACLIYASNGTMKTSFAKTFKDISMGTKPMDEIFHRPTSVSILKSTGMNLEKDEVFVIDSYNQEFASSKISSLLVNKALQAKYNEIHFNIDKKKQELLNKMKVLSGIRNGIEDECCITFNINNFLEIIEELEERVLRENQVNILISEIKYSDLFNPKVIDFLKKGNSAELIAEYSEKFNDLIEQSKFFRKGIFTHNNAADIGESLSKNGFFGANHTISLNGKEVITTQEELDKIIQEEKNKILTDPELKKRFDKIDSTITRNAELREFRRIIENFPEIIPELNDINNFKKKFWVLILKNGIEEYYELLALYKDGKVEIRKIIDEAKREQTEWQKVVEIFNDRFSVPFEIYISNQEDVILRSEAPTIGFKYKDKETSQEVEKNQLLNALSTGEKRAFYLLNIIFEIQARKQEGKPVLLIADDIADSFDYKNKYAIVEYLKEILECGIFYTIILTHNYDFYRTIGGRLLSHKNCYMIIKHEARIELIPGGYLKNVFNTWKEKLEIDRRILIASIPFVRNIVEYLEVNDSPNYNKLTSLLHMRDDTKTIKLSDLEVIYNNVWTKNKNLPDKDKTIFEIIFEEADILIKDGIEKIKLENKIVLSIAIRLLAEDFMISKIADSTITRNKKTGELFDIYKSTFPNEKGNIKIFEKVNLMTPENIHLNSFMYEPILDLSDDYLKNLYTDVKGIAV